MTDYVVDLSSIKEDIALALGATGGITPYTPCWKCGAIEPAHACDPSDSAKRRLKAFADAETAGNEPLRRWPGPAKVRV
jgi:hypothetical protein